MIVGIGTDVVELARMEQSLTRTPGLRDRLFTPAEGARSVETLAGRFAAKEALSKALGAPPGMGWHDAEVVGEHGEQPRFVLRGTVAARMAELGADRVHLSITHDAGVAVAFVVVESSA